MPILTTEQLEALRRYNTPTISNAIEIFDVRPRHVGFLPHHDPLPVARPRPDRRLRGDLADRGGLVARRWSPTARPTISATSPPQPGPKIAVGQDLDDPPGLGAQFGEVNATIHKKLGCVGHITDGCPRDLDEVARPRASSSSASTRASATPTSGSSTSASPSGSAGVEIQPGDLIHADKHGVCIIPLEIAHRAGRGLRRGRADESAPARDLPVRRVRPGGIPPAPISREGEERSASDASAAGARSGQTRRAGAPPARTAGCG